ncbi:MAG: 23S rRNA (adenine(2503)-C(2))-methyltransferase RlmN [Exilispira sp.]
MEKSKISVPKLSIVDLILNETITNQIIKEYNIKSYRITQLLQWIFLHNIFNIENMTNIDNKSKDFFFKNIEILPLKIIDTLKEDQTNTIKLLFQTIDDFLIEIVILQDKNKRRTLCLSTQIGCAMDCKFCATGKVGFSRNLTSSEMLWEYLITKSLFGQIDNIVLMGMGEPFLNFENTKNFIYALVKNKIDPYSPRRITISTSGVRGFSIKAIELNLPVKLSISLHSPFDEIRRIIMPNSLKISDLIKECDYYIKYTKKRITFEYILLEGITDDKKSIAELIKLAKRFSAFVNLISYNEIDGLEFKSSKNENRIISELENSGINFSIRYKRGEKIKGACGQLVWEKRNI